jgi:hypothetical protein
MLGSGQCSGRSARVTLYTRSAFAVLKFSCTLP